MLVIAPLPTSGALDILTTPQGYYFPTSQEVSQRQIAEATAKIFHKKSIISSLIAKSISEQEMASLYPSTPDLGFTTFACNSRSKADRAAKELGYLPTAPSFWDTLESDLTDALGEEA